MKTLACIAVTAATGMLLVPVAASAEEPCGTGALTRSIHNVHEVLEPIAPALGEAAHGLECTVAPLDPTR